MVFSLIKKNQSKEVKREIDEYIVFSKKSLELNLNKKETFVIETRHFSNTRPLAAS